MLSRAGQGDPRNQVLTWAPRSRFLRGATLMSSPPADIIMAIGATKLIATQRFRTTALRVAALRMRVRSSTAFMHFIFASNLLQP